MAGTKFPHLFSQLKVGTHTYKNRVVAAPIYCGTFGTIPFLSSVFFQAFRSDRRAAAPRSPSGRPRWTSSTRIGSPSSPSIITDFDRPFLRGA